MNQSFFFYYCLGLRRKILWVGTHLMKNGMDTLITMIGFFSRLLVILHQLLLELSALIPTVLGLSNGNSFWFWVLILEFYLFFFFFGFYNLWFLLGMIRIHRAGPREKIYFRPEQVKAAIITCGGLCPGLNDVIRHVSFNYCLKTFGII